MKIFQHYTFLLLFSLSTHGSFSLQGQSSGSTFSSKSLTAFALIFNETTKMENSIDIEIIGLLQEYNVSYGRYREVITNNINDGEISSFSENEKMFFEAIRTKNEELKTRVEKLELQLCKEYLLEPNIYLDIKTKFVTSPKFQNEIYPYFEKIQSGENRH